MADETEEQGERQDPDPPEIPSGSDVSADDPGYPRLWDAVNANNHGRYSRYQAKTSRKIPVVVITAS